MDIKIGLIGAGGRMGKAISSLHAVIPITRTTSRASLDCDILIDVSSHQALRENLSANKPIVIGTTGHLDFAPIQEAARYLPIFYAPNFSLGAALLNKLATLAAQYFPSDIDIIETHHTQKKDAPSGFALLLAKNLPNPRIHSIRSGKIIGEHTVLFNTAEERITLTHEAHTRDVFAQGALAAARFLLNKPPGLYTMDNLFQ
jgi:4-hydroxy-tetrahydrodipicolinate reductase